MVFRIDEKEKRNPKTDIVIHSWPWSGQQKPLVKIQSAQVVNIRSAATRRDLALTVGNYGRTASIYNLLSECARFGLTGEVARKQIDSIVNVVRGWREHFFASGVSAQDVEYIGQAFLPEGFFFEAPPER